MAPASDPDLLVLHTLRLKSFAPTEVVAAATGLDEAEAAERLGRLRDQELARYREGALTGWMLTKPGRADAEQRLHAELDATGTRPAIEVAYRRFLGHNQPLLQVCTDWQLRPGPPGAEPVLNDHADPEHDRAAVDALVAIDAAAQPICAELAAALDRFAGYGPRFGAALGRVVAGEHDWFTKPTIDSYHTVWFELHENLLATLGIERGSEVTS